MQTQKTQITVFYTIENNKNLSKFPKLLFPNQSI